MGGQLAAKALTDLCLIWQIVLSGGQITRNPCKAVTLHFDVFNVGLVVVWVLFATHLERHI